MLHRLEKDIKMDIVQAKAKLLLQYPFFLIRRNL